MNNLSASSADDDRHDDIPASMIFKSIPNLALGSNISALHPGQVSPSHGKSCGDQLASISTRAHAAMRLRESLDQRSARHLPPENLPTNRKSESLSLWSNDDEGSDSDDSAAVAESTQTSSRIVRLNRGGMPRCSQAQAREHANETPPTQNKASDVHSNIYSRFKTSPISIEGKDFKDCQVEDEHEDE